VVVLKVHPLAQPVRELMFQVTLYTPAKNVFQLFSFWRTFFFFIFPNGTSINFSILLEYQKSITAVLITFLVTHHHVVMKMATSSCIYFEICYSLQQDAVYPNTFLEICLLLHPWIEVFITARILSKLNLQVFISVVNLKWWRTNERIFLMNLSEYFAVVVIATTFCL
jgi:hypothetical protein